MSAYIASNKAPSGLNFDNFAKKLRMEKFDKQEIQQLKNDAIMNEKLKNKKKRSALIIQKFFRGHLLRKKFKSIMDDINTNIIIEYFNNKRKERIRENYKEIILRNLDAYIDRKREIKRIIIYDYYNYCATMIRKTFSGWKLRRNFIPVLKMYKKSKEKISALVNSFKVRLILRTNKLQDVLVEIANIQNCLNMLQHDDGRNSDKTEKLKTEFTKRLPKALLSFYEEFYKIKENRNWVNYIKCDRGWLDKFIQIMTTGTFKSVFTENPNILNKSLTDLNSSRFIQNFNSSGNNFYNPGVVGMLNSSYENVNAVVNMNKSILEAPENKNNLLDYDNKPIRVNPKKMYDLARYPETSASPEPVIEGSVEKKVEPKKKNKVSPLRRKAPKYDARKAIEEAEKKEVKEPEDVRGRSNDRGEFRKFLKEMREKDEKIADGNNNGKSDTKQKKEKENKSPTKGGGGFGGGLSSGGAVDNSESKPKKKEDEENNTRRKKVVTTEINMRRKLHELEKSPPPKIDVKNIKSKIDCWGTENEITFNIKNIKGDDLDHNKTSKPVNKKQEYYSKLETDFKSINNGFNLNDYLKTKTTKMKDYSAIPYIKTDSFYVKHYSNEIYDQLLLHLSKHYEELKN